MSSDRELMHIVRSWMEEGVDAVPDRVVADVLAQLPVTPQRRPWWRAWRELLVNNTLKFAAAGTFALAVAAVAYVLYFSRPTIPPAASPSTLAPIPSALATPRASAGAPASEMPTATTSGVTGLVAYTAVQAVDPLPETCSTITSHPWCHVSRIWVANSNGSGAHELLPDVPGNQNAIAWMPDGTRLLYAEDRGLALTDLSGAEQEIITATQCPEGTVTNCPILGGSLSPDGTQLAYTLYPGDQADASVVAVFDLVTKQITLLESTHTTGLNLSCRKAANQGDNGSPLWSPDGTRLVVTRSNIGPLDERGNCRSIIYSVNADGTDFKLLLPGDGRHQPSSAGWSPDGSLLLVSWVSSDPNGGFDATCDVATIRSDGSAFRLLTSDGNSCGGGWLRDGRILVEKSIDLELGTFELWAMDADGTNLRLGDRSIAALTTIGCVVCPAPPSTNWSDVLWQPIP